MSKQGTHDSQRTFANVGLELRCTGAHRGRRRRDVSRRLWKNLQTVGRWPGSAVRDISGEHTAFRRPPLPVPEVSQMGLLSRLNDKCIDIETIKSAIIGVLRPAVRGRSVHAALLPSGNCSGVR